MTTQMIIRRTALAALLAIAFFAGMLNTQFADANKTHSPNMLPKTMRHACATEDSVNCYWNAAKQGNHKGHSYIVRLLPGKAHMICVFYINKKDAKKWDYCSGDLVKGMNISR